ncbi:MAG: hypothetical protein AB7F82_00990 [Alphaproteobacteria bacterium]
MELEQQHEMFARAQSGLTRLITQFQDACHDGDQNTQILESRIRRHLDNVGILLSEITDTTAAQWLPERNGIKLSFRETDSDAKREKAAVQLDMARIAYSTGQDDACLRITHDTMKAGDFLANVANAAINKRIDHYRSKKTVTHGAGPGLRAKIAQEVQTVLDSQLVR